MNHEQVFKSHPVKTAFSLFAVLCVWITITYFLVRWIAGDVHLGTAAWSAIMLLSSLLCVWLVLSFNTVRVTVTEREVTVKIPKKKAVVWPRDSYEFSSNVTTHYTNGIKTHTVRALVAINEKGAKNTHLPNIGKKDFDKLVALLRRVPAPGAETAAESVQGSFDVPREAILHGQTKIMKIILGGIAAIGIGVTAWLTWAGNSNATISAEQTALGTGLFFLAMLVGFGIPLWINYKNRKAATPDNVRIDQSQIVIGQTRYALREIEGIAATPPSYENVSFRKLTLVARGRRTQYLLGSCGNPDKRKSVMCDYGQMCMALEKVAAGHGIEFLYDL